MLCLSSSTSSLCDCKQSITSNLRAFLSKLTVWSRVLPEKLTSTQLVKKLATFMGPEGSLPHSQAHATCPYPEPAQCSPCLPSHFLKIHFNIIFPSMPNSSGLCSSGVTTKTLYASFHHICYMLCLSHFLDLIT